MAATETVLSSRAEVKSGDKRREKPNIAFKYRFGLFRICFGLFDRKSQKPNEI